MQTGAHQTSKEERKPSTYLDSLEQRSLGAYEDAFERGRKG